MNKREVSGVVFLDLRKAFDTVDHRLIIQKLELYGVEGVALLWFESYLSQRTQCVSIDGLLSSAETVSTGVPQGSVLGPLLFIIYVNDLSHWLHFSKCNMFADDTAIYFSAKTANEVECNLNYDLGLIQRWLNVNRLSLNIDKTVFMLIGSRQKLNHSTNISIFMGGGQIKRVSATKYLGVIIDETLSFSDHVDMICKKCNRSAGALKRVKYLLPQNIQHLVVHSTVMPAIDYCDSIYMHTSQNNLSKLQKRHNYCAKLLTGKQSATASMVQLQWLDLASRRQLHLGTIVYKVMNGGNVPSHMRQSFIEPPGGYSLRRRVSASEVPTNNNLYFQRTFSHAGKCLWNNLPANIKCSSSIFSFKKLYSDLLRRNLFS
jgi:hypothetical protein